ncbi:MAG TPA: hypothetical protein DDX11_01910 [Candidatus Peribacter riflensis]|nr:hypothetical protein [Candidatus Peribacter riflensis]
MLVAGILVAAVILKFWKSKIHRMDDGELLSMKTRAVVVQFLPSGRRLIRLRMFLKSIGASKTQQMSF